MHINSLILATSYSCQVGNTCVDAPKPQNICSSPGFEYIGDGKCIRKIETKARMKCEEGFEPSIEGCVKLNYVEPLKDCSLLGKGAYYEQGKCILIQIEKPTVECPVGYLHNTLSQKCESTKISALKSKIITTDATPACQPGQYFDPENLMCRKPEVSEPTSFCPTGFEENPVKSDESKLCRFEIPGEGCPTCEGITKSGLPTVLAFSESSMDWQCETFVEVDRVEVSCEYPYVKEGDECVHRKPQKKTCPDNSNEIWDNGKFVCKQRHVLEPKMKYEMGSYEYRNMEYTCENGNYSSIDNKCHSFVEVIPTFTCCGSDVLQGSKCLRTKKECPEGCYLTFGENSNDIKCDCKKYKDYTEVCPSGGKIEDGLCYTKIDMDPRYRCPKKNQTYVLSRGECVEAEYGSISYTCPGSEKTSSSDTCILEEEIDALYTCPIGWNRIGDECFKAP